MASAGAWYRVGSVAVTNGSANVVGTGSQWVNDVVAIAIGDIFTVDSKTWYEVIAITDDTNITLDRPFEGATNTSANYAIVRNTSGTVLTRIAGQITVQFNQKQLFLDELRTWLNSSNATENLTDSHGVSHSVTTPTQMANEHASRVAQVDSLIGSVQAMTKAEFDAIAESNRAQFAGSGFVEWGKSDSTWESVNEGMGAVPSISNQIRLGRGNATNLVGNSASLEPIINAEGVIIHLRDIGNDSDLNSIITLPDAPDGLDKLDGTGRFADLASAIVAGGNDLSQSVISRQDFVFLEVWHEKISAKDVVFPFGNVQYGTSTWQGVTLSNTVVAQGYSAFGDWDSATKGYGVVWSTLTDANKNKFIQDKQNNIYADNGELIQVRYRVRVIKGLGNVWNNVDPQFNQIMRYGVDNTTRVLPQGMLTATVDSKDISSNAGVWFASSTYNNTTHQSGAFIVQGSATAYSHNGECYAIPIALASRQRNKGGYHPELNPHGTNPIWDNVGGTQVVSWYKTLAKKPASVADCFDIGSVNAAGNVSPFVYSTGGNVYNVGNAWAYGNPDQLAYDAIYADDIIDLRNSAKPTEPSKILHDAVQGAIDNTLHVHKGTPILLPCASLDAAGSYGDIYSNDFDNGLDPVIGATVFGIDSDGTTVRKMGRVLKRASYTQLTLDVNLPRTNGNYWVCFHSKATSANPNWVDIIAEPLTIAAMYPNGIAAQWNPEPLDGTTRSYALTQKADSAYFTLNSSDSGATWNYRTDLNTDFVAIDNAATLTIGASDIYLVFYKTGGLTLEDSSNSVVLAKSDAFICAHHELNYGAALANALIGKVNVMNWGVIQGVHANNYWLYNNKYSTAGGFKPELINKPVITNQSGKSVTNVLPYLTSENGRYFVQFIYKEALNDGNSWGDDNKFTITGGVTTITDTNGAKIVAGQKRYALPYLTREK